MMSPIIQPSRRGFLTGLTALVAAPAIVRATSLMPIASPKDYLLLNATESYSHQTLLTLRQITREAIEQWRNTNQFLDGIDQQYDLAFRINLPPREWQILKYRDDKDPPEHRSVVPIQPSGIAGDNRGAKPFTTKKVP